MLSSGLGLIKGVVIGGLGVGALRSADHPSTDM